MLAQKEKEKENEISIDFFCGGGGASEGYSLATGEHIDIAINHCPKAIEMHKINHPETKHLLEDVWLVDPIETCNGRPIGKAWFSPTCTYFSKARGGKPVSVQMRGQAWVVLHWATKVPMRTFYLENVEEFLDWGPLDENNMPIKDLAGRTFQAFVDCLTTGIDPNHPDLNEIIQAVPGIDVSQLINGMGYQVEWKILRACDYGAPTIRKRLFLMARRDGRAIIWPKPTHCNNTGKDEGQSKAKGLLPWRTTAEIIDWSIPTKSIFGRKKPLAEKTMQRIAKGIQKYVIDAEKPFVVPHNGQIPFITEHANGSSQRNMPIDEPMRTQCANVKGGHFALVRAHMVKFRGSEFGFDCKAPLPTVTSGGRHFGVVYSFMMQYYGTLNTSSLEEPLRTVTTKARLALVTVRIGGENYVIVDIGMRMLNPRELSAGMGFEDWYIIEKDSKGKKNTIVNQVARIGNAVSPQVAEALIKANLGE